MDELGLRKDMVLLAGTTEVRTVRSTVEAERELASGFRPAVVLLGSDLRGAGASEFARWIRSDPDRAGIPVLVISCDAGWVRITLVDEDVRVPARPEELTSILEVLEDLCAEPFRLAG